jgi:mRNA interferase MazF
VTEAYCPDEGDIIWLDFDPQKGHEQRGRRPALVLSPQAYNRRVGLCVLCPITTAVKGFPFEVPVPEEGVIHGAVLSDQVKSLSWSERGSEFAEKASVEVMAHVRAKLKALLRIP